MKKALTLVVIGVFVSLLLKSVSPVRKSSSDLSATASPSGASVASPKPLNVLNTHSRSVFVPYWALDQDDYASFSYDGLYYFGIAATTNGIDSNEEGYRNLERFNCPQSKKCSLVVRMLDSNANHEILSNAAARLKIIKQTLEAANLHSFQGIALDLEIASLSNTDTTNQINTFVQEFYNAAQEDYKMFSFIVYGDVFYRKRPYDLSFISRHTDEIMIMAYDLQKSYGEPGPNFSYEDKNKYGYDFKKMVEDFKGKAESEKITVILGMYGYDWTLNPQGTPLKQAKAITVNQINILKAQSSNLKTTTLSSKEKKLEYVDGEGQKHILWYEDEESAETKINHLKEQGIGSVSYWAWGYFNPF